jgi:hypothetical protein
MLTAGPVRIHFQWYSFPMNTYHDSMYPLRDLRPSERAGVLSFSGRDNRSS